MINIKKIIQFFIDSFTLNSTKDCSIVTPITQGINPRNNNTENKASFDIDKIYEEFEHKRFIGISFDKQRKLYRARYYKGDKPIFIGRYKTLEEAKKAYIHYTKLNNLQMRFYR